MDSSDEDYLSIKYPKDGIDRSFINKNFPITSQDLRDAGPSVCSQYNLRSKEKGKLADQNSQVTYNNEEKKSSPRKKKKVKEKQNKSVNSSEQNCSHCNQIFKNQRGVNAHIRRAHPEIYRSKILNNKPSEYKNLEAEKYPEIINKQSNESNEKLKIFNADILEWERKFNTEAFDNEDTFGNMVENFGTFLANSLDYLPGPKHPAKKYYEARKKKGFRRSTDSYKKSTNPQRSSKRRKEQRKAEYEYQVTQFLYYNQRRKAVRRVLADGKHKNCSLDLTAIDEYFRSRFENKNDCCREDYEEKLTVSEQFHLDKTYLPKMTEDDVKSAIKSIKIDTSPGPDRIIMRCIKNNSKIISIISKIGSFMLQSGFVPKCYKIARTVLFYKKGEISNLDNWRPISICSIIRRIIEKIIDKQVRKYIIINENQRGFMHMPGCHINNLIVENILKKSKKDKGDVSLFF